MFPFGETKKEAVFSVERIVRQPLCELCSGRSREMITMTDYERPCREP